MKFMIPLWLWLWARLKYVDSISFKNFVVGVIDWLYLQRKAYTLYTHGAHTAHSQYFNQVNNKGDGPIDIDKDDDVSNDDVDDDVDKNRWPGYQRG